MLSTIALAFVLFASVAAFVPPHHQVRNSRLVLSRALLLPQEAVELKESLVESIKDLRFKKAQDGDFSIDFGVKGGELNETTRAPQKVDFYSISKDVGQAADNILRVCDNLAKLSPIEEPTLYLGNKVNGTKAPLHGPWKLLFSTAADASFSKNSTRGDARAQNVVDGARGSITNVIDFASKPDGIEPVLKQLQVVIKATAVSKTRVELNFRYAKAVLTRFFFLPIRWTLFIPVPAAFITRCIVFLSRIFKFGRGRVKKLPKAYFDVLYLDDDLRIHRTGEDNLFVQARETWEAAQPLLE